MEGEKQTALINGIPQPLGPGAEITHPEVAVRARVGQTVLVRSVSAGYFPSDWNFHPGRTHGERLDVQVVASDGRPFVATDAGGGAFHPRFARQTLRMGPAERYDAVVTATTPDVYPVTVDTLDWLSLEDAGQPRADRVRGTVRTTITFTK
jgi:FtsP/CotA-like multicopper oxidase with cupredoxin domain